MSFFPISNISKANGYCTLHNYQPNNWEPIMNCKKKVWAIYSDGEKWLTKYLNTIDVGESQTYSFNDVYKGNGRNPPSLILLQFRKTPLANNLEILPDHEFDYTITS